MTVKDLRERVARLDDEVEVIILDVTDPDPEETIQLYVKDVDYRPEQGPTVYLLLAQ